MNIFPEEKEIEKAVDLLINKYNISPQLLSQLFGSKQKDRADIIIKNLGEKVLTKPKIAKLLIYRQGCELFSGSSDDVQELRKKLIKQLPEDKIKQLFDKHNPNPTTSIKTPCYMVNPLANKKWHNGGRWAKDFVEATGFPPIFAGVVQRNTPSAYEDVEPLIRPPDLVDFQKSLQKKMLEILNREGDKTRCVVTLPTGGGKTRVAVEAFIEWMQPRFANGKYLIWIAQSEELCEQAIKCIQQMWSSKEFVGSLRIYRCFGNREIKLDDLQGGAVVASIQKLHSKAKSESEELDIILKDTGAMIIDEAHRAVTKMYTRLLERAEKICGKELFPICGLTATPGRSGLNRENEIPKLVDRFEANLISPELGPNYLDNPLQYFRDLKYLAKAHHIVYRSGIEYQLTDREIEKIDVEDSNAEFPGVFLKKLANDEKRNKLIIERLLKIPEKEPTLIYACTVEHAEILAAILTYMGQRAGSISSNTSLTIRRGLIKEFKERKFNFLCNYGVLTTGFDVPQISNIVICRPIRSEILYEQIVGRGLRGSKFGGTDDCNIIDFADNIEKLGQPLSYARFQDFWTDEKEENH